VFLAHSDVGFPCDECGGDYHTGSYVGICRFCKFYDAANGFECTAFPAGIPAEIREGRFDHRQPFPETGDRMDNGITFQSDEDWAEQWGGDQIPDDLAKGLLWPAILHKATEQRGNAMLRAHQRALGES
jgi:hypothetical protein